jgi:two-component system OmpR family response regulator
MDQSARELSMPPGNWGSIHDDLNQRAYVSYQSKCRVIKIRILLVEDEAAFAQRVRATLTEAGFVTDLAADGNEGWMLGDTQTYDAAILDLGLPMLSGLDILKRWRHAGSRLPVLILTARSGWLERVNGLNAGADDYLEKPIQTQELVARLRALLRRSSGKIDPTIRHGDLELDTTTGVASKAGRSVDLTALELRILEYLMYRTQRFVPKSELLAHIYTINEFRDANSIEVYIARLRKKLGRGAIRTVRGMGYRIG